MKSRLFRSIATLLAASALTACETSTSYVSAPIPALSPSIAEPCPPLPPLADGTLGTLTTAAADDAVAYEECQTRHRKAVEAYNRVRATNNGEKP